jgi:uncharacterized protein with ParB-like and HNH nuclease domain
MEIKDIFGAQPKSVWEFMSENGQGFYIPSYQRHYSWDRSKIERLIDDVCHGFNLLLEKEDSITFLGTIIAIHDTTFTTISPHVRGEVPPRVMTIIDGQQRLTTLFILNTVLHEEIKIRSKKITRTNLDDDESADTWLEQECLKISGRLTKTYQEDKDYGDESYRFYPRMIRAYDDSWSRRKNQAHYKSPIGFYLHSYGEYGRKITSESFQTPSTDDPKQKFLNESRKIIKGLLKKIAKLDVELSFPSFELISNSKRMQETLIHSDFPECVLEHLSKKEHTEYKELLRLVLFANFILDRVALTIVTARNEDYAFDMFESLNTTGEPLTSFETFKPRVIASEGLEKYEQSESHSSVNIIEEYLESFGKSDEKQDATSKLIVAFSLAESGEKLSKRISDQRRYLRESYEKNLENSQEYKRKFILHLSHSAIFMKEAWPENKKIEPDLRSINAQNDEHALLCLDLLRQLNHTITLAPLIRFFSACRIANNEERKKTTADFIEALKAITAFSVLWRSSRPTTAGIDNHYRNLMSEGHQNSGLAPLSRCTDGINQKPLDVKSLKTALKNILKIHGGISGKDDWVNLTSKQPIYSINRDVSRFLLLAAAHDSSPDVNNPGLITSGRQDTLPLLNFSTWKKETLKSVEHIAPINNSQGWHQSIYEDADFIHRIGNLTLLPIAENSTINNSAWTRKKFIYKILSASTRDELDKLLVQARNEDIRISESSEDLLSQSKFLPLVKSISTVETEWNKNLIEKRSIRLSELAWDNISPMLYE